jgi:Flp pilus assembly protein TadG
MQPIETLLNKAKALREQEQGAVALIFAFALIPLLGFAGLAIDYGLGVRDAAMLATAVDSAALRAVSPTSQAYQLAKAASGDGVVTVDATPYIGLMQANIGANSGMTLQGAPTVTIRRAGLNVTAQLTATASIKTTLMSLFGYPTITVTKTSTATTNLPTYMDFHLLLDNTPSMGVGATQADINKLISLTTSIKNNPNEAKCGFACHVADEAASVDYYTIARNNNVTLRIDLLRQATQNLMDTANNQQKISNVSGLYRFAVYDFGASANAAQTSVITNIVPLTSNTGSVKTQVSSLDLMSVDYQGQYNDQDTSFDTVLPAIGAVIPTPGDGSSTTSRQQILLFVTDGLSDENLGGNRTIKPINTALCTAIKNRNIQIAVLYTTYYPLPTNAFYVANVAPIVDQIGPALQQCASSPSFYQAVATGGDVSSALSALFNNVIAKSRLTQ